MTERQTDKKDGNFATTV